MSATPRFNPARRWIRALYIFASYVLASNLIPVILLLLIEWIGYLPYSDRPGPGWQHPHLPERAEVSFYLSFALMLCRPTLFYAAAHTLLAAIYELCSLPRWLVRILGGITAFLSAGLLMGGVGWMIAIAPIGVYLAAGCGLLWGVLLLPAWYAPREHTIPLWLRIGAVLLCCGGGIFYLLRPFLPRKPTPPINLSIVRITPSAGEVDWTPSEFFSQQTWTELNNLHLHGDIHGGIQSGTSGEGETVDIAVIALQPINRKYKIAVPASGHVVYVLDHDTLTPHPAFSSKDDRSFTLKPGEDKTLDGGTLRPSDFDKDETFTWSPAIAR